MQNSVTAELDLTLAVATVSAHKISVVTFLVCFLHTVISTTRGVVLRLHTLVDKRISFLAWHSLTILARGTRGSIGLKPVIDSALPGHTSRLFAIYCFPVTGAVPFPVDDKTPLSSRRTATKTTMAIRLACIECVTYITVLLSPR